MMLVTPRILHLINRQLLVAIVMLMQDNSILSQSHGVENLTELLL